MNGSGDMESSPSEQPLLEDRKMDYVKSANGIEPQSQTSVSSISVILVLFSFHFVLKNPPRPRSAEQSYIQIPIQKSCSQ